MTRPSEKQVKYFRSLSNRYKRECGIYGRQNNRKIGHFIENIERYLERGELTAADMSRAIDVLKREFENPA